MEIIKNRFKSVIVMITKINIFKLFMRNLQHNTSHLVSGSEK